MNVVIDADPGTDDAIALCAAVHSDSINVLGITIVGGNVHRSLGTSNALAILDFIGATEIPIVQGADRPLKGSFTYAYDYHGKDGLSTTIPQSTRPASSISAIDFIRATCSPPNHETTLIALGPLTNIAEAIQMNQELANGVKRIFVMGGALEVDGNVTPWAEFNIHQDPVAANVVFSSGIPITLLSLDVCDQIYVNRGNFPPSDNETKERFLTRSILEGWFHFKPEMERYTLCDPTAVAASENPDLFEYRQASIKVVETGKQKGRTMAKYGDGSVDVAINCDPVEVLNHISGMLS